MYGMHKSQCLGSGTLLREWFVDVWQCARCARVNITIHVSTMSQTSNEWVPWAKEFWILVFQFSFSVNWPFPIWKCRISRRGLAASMRLKWTPANWPLAHSNVVWFQLFQKLHLQSLLMIIIRFAHVAYSFRKRGFSQKHCVHKYTNTSFATTLQAQCASVLKRALELPSNV